MSRERIEDEISKSNVKHFTTAHGTIARRDKTCEKLREKITWDRMLKGQLRREECDNEKVCGFLKLLKKPTEDRRDQEEKIATEKYWIKVAKQSKKQSASSMFSSRKNSVCKRALGS